MTATALVTGGNRGIGLEVCRQLARRGYRTWLAARAPAAGRAAADALRAEGHDVSAVSLDVASPASVEALGERAEREGWQLDALINNAAVSRDGFDASVVRSTLEVNSFGAVRVSDALAPRLLDGARVVNVSSGMGTLDHFGPEARARLERVESREALLELLEEIQADVAAGRHSARGWPGNAYSISKAALNAFTRLFAREQPRLRVNSVCPGWVRTRMGGASAPRGVEAGARGITWAAALPSDGPTGSFFRDERAIPW